MNVKKLKGHKRTEKLQISCTPKEKAFYSKKAEQLEMTVAEYVRATLRGQLRAERRKVG